MFEAEVVVAVQGLEYVIDLVLSELMVEGVSRAVIQNLQEDGVDRSTIRHLLPMLTNSQEVSINVAFCLLVEDAPDLAASTAAFDHCAIDPP
ncbi:hypothetical protein V6N13_048317 [Hibiscus sabdariffa]